MKGEPDGEKAKEYPNQYHSTATIAQPMNGSRIIDNADSLRTRPEFINLWKRSVKHAIQGRQTYAIPGTINIPRTVKLRRHAISSNYYLCQIHSASLYQKWHKQKGAGFPPP